VKWWIISKVIFKTWLNSLQKGFRRNPLLLLTPVFLIGLAAFYSWSSYHQFLALSQFNLLSNQSREMNSILSRLVVLVFLATFFSAVILLQFSPPRKEFLRIFLPLPIAIGDILLGYCSSFVLLLFFIVSLISLPAVIAIGVASELGVKTALLMLGYVLFVISTVFLGVLFWSLAEIISREILGKQGEQFAKILIPVLFAIIPFSYVAYFGSKAFFNLFSKLPVFPSFWFIAFLNSFKSGSTLFLLLTILLALGFAYFIVWFLIAKIFWRSTIASGKGVVFLKKLPFFSTDSLINLAVIEIKQSLRDVEGWGYLFLLFLTSLFLASLFRQLTLKVQIFQVSKFTLYLLAIALGAFALLSRVRDIEASWLFNSLPLTFKQYAVGKCLGNIVIALAAFWSGGFFFLSLVNFSFKSRIIGLLNYSTDIVVFATVAYLCGALYKIKKENPIDELLLVVIYGILLSLVISFLRQAVKVSANTFGLASSDLIGAFVNLALAAIIIALATAFEGLGKVS
jgi:hypothetical protein